MNWFIHSLKNTFNFKGRARRREYGWFMLMNFLINLLGGALMRGAPWLGVDALTLFITVAYSIFGIVLFIAALSLNTRRLHDLGYSGWWQLAPMGLNLLMVLLLLLLTPSADTAVTTGIGFIAIATLLSVVLLLVLLFKDGQRFANKYGADPKATNLAETSTETTLIP